MSTVYLTNATTTHLPDGLRCSTDCVARQYREYIDPSLYPPFPVGLGQAGHDAADRFGERFLGGVFDVARNGWKWPAGRHIEAELPIVWEHGTTHLDFVDFDNDVSIEVKSVGRCAACDATVTTSPQAYQRRQVERQQRHALRAGVMLGYSWVVYIVCRNCVALHGPFTIRLSDDRLAAIDADVERVGRWMTSGIDVDAADVIDACTCGRCKPPLPRVEAPLRLDDLHVDLSLIEDEYAAASEARKQARAQIKALLEPGRVYETSVGTLQLDARGALRTGRRRG